MMRRDDTDLKFFLPVNVFLIYISNSIGLRKTCNISSSLFKNLSFRLLSKTKSIDVGFAFVVDVKCLLVDLLEEVLRE